MTSARFNVQCRDCGGFHAAARCAAFDALLREACIALDASTPEIYQQYCIDRPGGRWDLDDAAGRLTFTQADGRACDAECDFIGTYAAAPGSFKWGWDHPYATPAIRGAADRVLQEGRRIGAEVLTSNHVETDQEEVWHLAKIAAYIAGRPATYRVPANQKAWMYFAFARPAWRPL